MSEDGFGLSPRSSLHSFSTDTSDVDVIKMHQTGFVKAHVCMLLPKRDHFEPGV